MSQERCARLTNGQIALQHDLVLRSVLRHRQQLAMQLVLYIVYKLNAGVKISVWTGDSIEVLHCWKSAVMSGSKLAA